MQVTLTPHTEELLRQVLARNPGEGEPVSEQLIRERRCRPLRPANRP